MCMHPHKLARNGAASMAQHPPPVHVRTAVNLVLSANCHHVGRQMKCSTAHSFTIGLQACAVEGRHRKVSQLQACKPSSRCRLQQALRMSRQIWDTISLAWTCIAAPVTLVPAHCRQFWLVVHCASHTLHVTLTVRALCVTFCFAPAGR